MPLPAPRTLGAPKADDPLSTEPASRERKIIPHDTELLVQVVDISEKEINYTRDDGSKATVINFKFKIIEPGEFYDQWVWGETWPDFYPGNRCRLYRWVAELYGEQKLPDNFELDFGHLIGKVAKANIGYESGDRADGTKWEKNDVRWLNAADSDAVNAASAQAQVAPVQQFREANRPMVNDEPF